MASPSLLGPPARRRLRKVTTPEGISLPLELATRGARVSAMFLDVLLIGAGLFVLVLVLGRLPASWDELAMALFLLIFFLVRSFYFIVFELRWHGTTPGKRALGIRVIDRAGGRLHAEAIFARNLMREVELYLPLTLWVSLASADQESAVLLLLILVWVLILTLMPLFNKDRLRAGDIVAGTWVVEAPKAVLLPDLAETRPGARQALLGGRPTYQFTTEQLDIYGIYELQTLENVLRRQGRHNRQVLMATCQQIQRKIGWQAPESMEESAEPVDPGRFLNAFYAALRAHLENKMLLGVRRRDKHDRR